MLPQDDEQLERDFSTACLRLEITELEGMRQTLNRELASLPDANNLSEEAKEKMTQMMRVTERLQQLRAALKKPS